MAAVHLTTNSNPGRLLLKAESNYTLSYPSLNKCVYAYLKTRIDTFSQDWS